MPLSLMISFTVMLSFCFPYCLFAQDGSINTMQTAPISHTALKGDELILLERSGQKELSRKPVVKLYPKVRVLTKAPLSNVNETLVLPYLEPDRLISPSMLAESARVIGVSDGAHYLTDNQYIYINQSTPHVNWHIYRPLNEYQRDQHTMIALKQIATATWNSNKVGYSGIRIIKQRQEVLVNDVVLPVDKENSVSFARTFYPSPAPVSTDASLLGALEGSHYVGHNQVVIIDRGMSDKLRQGSIFELYTKGASTAGGSQLPNIEIGNIMVIYPYQYFSLAVVTKSAQPISMQTLLKSPLNWEAQ